MRPHWTENRVQLKSPPRKTASAANVQLKRGHKQFELKELQDCKVFWIGLEISFGWNYFLCFSKNRIKSSRGPTYIVSNCLSLHLSSLAEECWGWGFQISEKGTDWLADWPSEMRARDTNRIWKVWSSYPSRDIRHICYGVISAAPSVLLMSGDVGIGYAWVYLGIPGFGYTCVLLKKPYTHFRWVDVSTVRGFWGANRG